MRTLLLAGVATVALAFGSVPALAGGFCGYHSLTMDNSDQFNCAVNIVKRPWWGSNDDNTQTITQSNTADGDWLDGYGNSQTNIGVNIVKKGDGNTQSISQSNSSSTPDEVNWQDQTNVGVNVVKKGDDNTQSITQTNSQSAAEDGADQTNVGVNTVEKGDGNTQTISQTNTITE